jgi:hypothetical protein
MTNGQQLPGHLDALGQLLQSRKPMGAISVENFVVIS